MIVHHESECENIRIIEINLGHICSKQHFLTELNSEEDDITTLVQVMNVVSLLGHICSKQHFLTELNSEEDDITTLVQVMNVVSLQTNR